jgi:hypothetical protein
LTAGFEGVTVTFGVVVAEAKSTKPPARKAQTRIHASTAKFELFIITPLIVGGKRTLFTI